MTTAFINTSKLPASPYGAQVTDPVVTPTPAWVPWAVGAAVGGAVLFLLLRK